MTPDQTILVVTPGDVVSLMLLSLFFLFAVGVSLVAFVAWVEAAVRRWRRRG